MQNGDLASWERERIVVILEGLLITLTEMTVKRRLRAPKVSVYNFHWHELPMKRLIWMRDHYPDLAIDIVTFVSEDVLDVAAQYLTAAHIPFDNISFEQFDNWTNLLKFQPDVRAVYDSNEERLEHYGQVGVGVTPGGDF